MENKMNVDGLLDYSLELKKGEKVFQSVDKVQHYFFLSSV